MGRPLNKKYFGNTNYSTTGEGVGGEGVASVTVVAGDSADYADNEVAVFTAPELAGGETATGYITVTGGAVATVVITNAGSGYTSAPTVTITTVSGTETTLALTAVLTTAGAARINAIAAYAYVTGNSLLADIVKQESSRRYKVATSEGTLVCSLVTDGAANAVGEMTIVATDSSAKTYYVKKLTAHKALLVPFGAAGHEFGSDEQSVKWTFGAAVLNSSVTIANN